MNVVDERFALFAFTILALWVSAQAGAYLRRRHANHTEADREDLAMIVAASLTLLGLIVGFSFSMATSRYDLRKNYEEEANAIGTEYVRAALLAPAPFYTMTTTRWPNRGI
jgi:hypothetical protein